MNTKSQGSRLIKNSVIVIFNTLFMMASTWVISIWVTRQLGPTNYGIFNMVLWVVGTFSWLIGMGLIHATTKFIAEYSEKKEKLNIRPIIFYVLKIEIAVSLVCTIILAVFSTQVADYFFTPKESFYFFIAALGLLPGMITAVFSSAIEGIQKFEYFAWSNLILSPLSFGAKVIVLFMGKGIDGLLFVMLLFSVLNVVFYTIVLQREGVFKASPQSLSAEIKKRIQKYNRSVLAILICDKIVWDKSENIFLGRFCSAAEIGYYNLGYNVVQRFVSILPTTFWRVLFPAMSGLFGTGDQDKMKRLFYLATRYLAFFAFPMGIAGMILAFPLIKYLYGSEFIDAQRPMQILFVASIFSSLSNPASAILYGCEKQSFIYKYGIILAIMNIILDFTLIKPYGATGAALCYGITTVFASVGGLAYTTRTMHLIYPFKSVVKIVWSTILMGIVMKAIMMQNHELPGFIIALFAGAIVYLVSSFFLSSFENEDFRLLNSIKTALPGKTKIIIDWFFRFCGYFKKDYAKRL